MLIVYRLLSFIVSAVALLLAVSLLFSIPTLLSSPMTMLSAFIMIAVILYAWFSFKFRRQVLMQKIVVPHTLKDWVRVNGIVSLVFSSMTTISVLSLIRNPQVFIDALKGVGFDMPVGNMIGFFYAMLCYAIILVIHILWTFHLLKKHREYFQ
jgi:hypothetical protein